MRHRARRVARWLAPWLVCVLAACRTLPDATVDGLARTQQAYADWRSAPADTAARMRYANALDALSAWLARQHDIDEAARALSRYGVRLDAADLDEPGMRVRLAAEVDTRRLERRHVRSGMGTPLVAWRPNDGRGAWDALRPPEGISIPATAILVADEDGWVLRLLSPLQHDQVQMAGGPAILAADFSAAFALLLEQRGTRKFGRSGFFGMFNPDGAERAEKVYLMKPYDPDRIVLLTVHGLQSTPLTFANLANDLFADPEFRKRYQLWQYHYPTGMAVLHNAAQLRRSLRDTLATVDPEGDDFASRHIVVLAHSMGGVISHTLVSDSGDALWDSVVTAQAASLTACPPQAVAALEDMLRFQRDPRVIRTIFVAAPHRGSDMANNWIGTLGQRLFHRNPRGMQIYTPLRHCARDQLTPYFTQLLDEGKFSSIRTLSRLSPPGMALSAIPPAVPFHSIIGQEVPGPKEQGSDGVVPYTSSHLPGAESELIVPYGHSAFRHPDAVAEIRRILALQAAQLPPAEEAP